MKKILTAEMQWRNALNDTHAKFGEFRNIEDHKIVDDGIGIIGDNCMYRFSDECCDYFFIKVGDVYKSIYVELSQEHLLADNWLKLDPQDAWYDKGKVLEWILQTHKECDISLEAPIQLYELIWMGIYNDKQVIITEYKTEYVETTYDNTPTVSQVEPIKVGNIKIVDADTLATQMNEELEEAESTPMYDREFLDHIEKIWREGHKTILVELPDEKYVINGLFDNDDVIIDCYVADTMQRIDRYFIKVGPEKFYGEAESYCEYFSEHIARERYIFGCWFLTDKQFEFLKNA